MEYLRSAKTGKGASPSSGPGITTRENGGMIAQDKLRVVVVVYGSRVHSTGADDA